MTEFKEMVNQIRKTEIIMGEKLKKIQPEELEMSKISKKSLYFNNDKKRNSKIRKSDLISLRPGIGISPFFTNSFVGRRLKKDIKKNQVVKRDLFL